MMFLTADTSDVAVVTDKSAGSLTKRFYRIGVITPTPTPTPTITPTQTPNPSNPPTPTPGSISTPTPTATPLFIPPVGVLTPTPTIGPLETNAAPIVSAGVNKIASVNETVHLLGTASDDGRPTTGQLTTYWTIHGGASPLAPANPSQVNTTITFAEPGTYLARLTASDSELSTSAEVTITVTTGTSQQVPSARSTRGTEFWIAFPGIGYQLIPSPTGVERPTAGGTNSRSNQEPDTLTPIKDAVATLYLIIAAEQGATGTVQVPGLSSLQSFTIAPGATKKINLPPQAMINVNDYVENKGVFVNTDQPVTVFAVARRDLVSQSEPGFPNPFAPRMADSLTAWLVHPTPSLGLAYRVVAPGTFFGSGFTIVATDDNTTVTIDLVVSYGRRTAGVPYQFVLQRGQTYQFRTDFPVYGEETGSTITADKPIAVIGGNDFRPFSNLYAWGNSNPFDYGNPYATQLSPIAV